MHATALARLVPYSLVHRNIFFLFCAGGMCFMRGGSLEWPRVWPVTTTQGVSNGAWLGSWGVIYNEAS
jgi:hypothetical protein